MKRRVLRDLLCVALVGLGLTPAANAATFDAATNALSQVVLKRPIPAAALAGARTPVEAADWELVTPVRGGSHPLPYAACWVFQVDGDGASEQIVRPRTLVVLAEDLSAFVTYETRVPAFLRRKADGRRQMLETLNDAAVPRAVLPRNAVTRAAQARSVTPFADTENNTNLYAVLISGGANAVNNGIRFYNDLVQAYRTLKENYAVPRENIFSFVASGVETNKEHFTGTTCVDVDYDLDGDGTNDVTGGAQAPAISACLTTLAQKLTPQDRLLVMFTTHGSPYDEEAFDNWTTFAWLWEDYVSDKTFRGWTDDIRCPVAFVLEQCYSGGFADDIVQRPDRVVATAANHLESSWGGSAYNCYVHTFFAALQAGSAKTFYDAAKAAYLGENFIAHPQYAESTAHLGYDFRFDAATPPTESYGLVTYDPNDDAAVCLTTNFAYRSSESAVWMPDAFSTNGFHAGWTQVDGATLQAAWIPFSRTNDTEIAGLSGSAAAQVLKGESFRWVWTAPQDTCVRLSLDGSVASGTLVLSNATTQIARDYGSYSWPEVSARVTGGTRYTITYTAESLSEAKLVWLGGDLYVAPNGNDADVGTAGHPLRTLQRAIDLSAEGATIHVAAGTYEPFASANKSVTISSVSGASATFIDGGGTNCCADMLGSSPYDADTRLVGFTLQNGHSTGSGWHSEANGAGSRGGSLYRCVIRNCTVSDAYYVYGGATTYGALYDCLVVNNAVSLSGWCYVYGGACYGSDLFNTTVADNAVSAPNGCVYGAGVFTYGEYQGDTLVWIYGAAYNTIVVGNQASAGYVCGANAYNNCGQGYVKSRTGGDPLFVDRANGDYRLAEGSPCIDAGYDDQAPEAVDLNGDARIQGGGVDLGCYESAFTAPDPVVPEAKPVRGNRYFGVFAGVNEYQNPSASTLFGAVRDAENMRTHCLRSGLWHEEDTTILTNALATESAVRAALAAYAAEAQSGDTFLYVQSSHGGNCVDDQMTSYLCLNDAGVRSGTYDGYYMDTELAADLKQFPEGVKILVYVDACRSGGLFKTWESNALANDLTLLGAVAQADTAVTAWNFAARVRAALAETTTPVVTRVAAPANARVSAGTHVAGNVGSNICFITAADYDQYSWDAGASQGGLFTAAFTDGWTSGAADVDGDQKLNFYELYDYAATNATGYAQYADWRTEAQCDNAARLVDMLAGYVPGAWPETEINPTDTPEEQAAKVQDAMVGAGFPPSTAAAVTNVADYAYLQGWAHANGIDLPTLASSPVALLSPAFGADGLLEITSNDVAVVSLTPPVGGAGTTWRMSLAITDYDPTRVNESLLKSAVGVTGSAELNGNYTTDELQLTVEKGETSIDLTVEPPADASQYFMRALVR